MKQIFANAVGVVALMLFFVPTIYGNETGAIGSGSGIDPTAMLLVEQGEQLMKSEGQLEGALASFDLAIEIDPAFSRAYFQASAVASQLGNYEKAIVYLEALRRQMPNDLEIQRRLADLEGKKNRRDPVPFASSGFVEFGIAALLGLVFFMFIAGHEFGEAPPAWAKAFQVEKPYFVYPLLKIWQGTQRELLAVHEKRHRSLQWQPRLHAP